MTLTKFSVNATVTGGSTRIEVFEGRDHMLAPCVAIVAGVLNGIMISAAEISIFTEAWNGIPLTVNHPMSGAIPISANSPDVIESQAIGRFWNAFFENDSLKGELWIDIQKAQDLGGEAVEILDRLENGGNLEVSTGFWAEHSNQVGTFKGKRFFATAHNIRPDHLALLPNDIGACNWSDGCGAPRINHAECEACLVDHPCETCATEGDDVSERKARNILEGMKKLLMDDGSELDIVPNKVRYARTPTYESISFDQWIEPTFSDFTTAFDSKTEEYKLAPIHLKRFIASHSLFGNSLSYDFKEGSRFLVVDPRTGCLNANALRQIAELDKNYVNFDGLSKEQVKSVQDKASALLAKIGEEIGEDVGMNIVANRTDRDIRLALEGELARREGFDFSFTFIESVDMENMVFVFFQGDRLMQQSFEIGEGGVVSITGDPVDVQRDTSFIPVPDTNKESDVTKEEKINQLIANSVEWKETDRGVLSITSEETIDKLLGVYAHCAPGDAAGTASGNAGPGSTEGATSPTPASAAPAAPVVQNQETPWTLESVPAEYRDFVASAMKERTDLIGRLAANEAVPFNELQLQTMSEDQMRKLEAAFTPQDFSMRGAPAPIPIDANAGQNGDGRRPDPPSTHPKPAQANA